MANRRSYIERDSRGRLVTVRSPSHHRSSSQGRPTTRELLNDAEEREQILIGEMQALRTQLSFAQRSEWQLERFRHEHQNLVNEHYHCRTTREQLEQQILRVEELLSEEEHKTSRLEQKYERSKEENRLLKRTSGESFRTRYEEKVQEVEVLRQRLASRDATIRLAETRIAEKNNIIDQKNGIINYLKAFLRREGFRVED